MSDCSKCRMMIEILKREAEELIEREQKLVRVNDALMEAMGKQHSLESEENDWKNKYEQQLQANLELEERIR